MTICQGRGPDGEHCCYIEGEVCEFLIVVEGVPRCSIWHLQMRKSGRWRNAPVGQWFAAKHPGYDCKDWPQNIPEVMAKAGTGIGLCCWEATS